MKTQLLTLALVVFSGAAALAQGTVQFVNGTLTRMRLDDHSGSIVNLPVNAGVNFGLFVNGSDTPIQPLGTASTTSAGIIVVANGTAYQIPGTNPGDTVSIQVRGWSSSFGSDWQSARAAVGEGAHYAETAVRSFVLGPTAGPGTVIWSGSDTTKLQPLSFVIVPEPSVIALILLSLGVVFPFLRKR